MKISNWNFSSVRCACTALFDFQSLQSIHRNSQAQSCPPQAARLLSCGVSEAWTMGGVTAKVIALNSPFPSIFRHLVYSHDLDDKPMKDYHLFLKKRLHLAFQSSPSFQEQNFRPLSQEDLDLGKTDRKKKACGAASTGLQIAKPSKHLK